VALVPAATAYRNLLVVAFLLGMAGSSFAVGVGYVSRAHNVRVSIRMGSSFSMRTPWKRISGESTFRHPQWRSENERGCAIS
jgi:hypothetical protein